MRNISMKGLVGVLGKSQEALVVAALASAAVTAMAGVLSPEKVEGMVVQGN